MTRCLPCLVAFALVACGKDSDPSDSATSPASGTTPTTTTTPSTTSLTPVDVPLSNASFEEPDLAADGLTFSYAVDSWTATGGGAHPMVTILVDDTMVAGGAHDGSQAVATRRAADLISGRLAPLQPDTEYALDLYLAARLDVDALPSGTSTLEAYLRAPEVGDPTVDTLLATLDVDHDTLQAAFGTWQAHRLSWTTDSVVDGDLVIRWVVDTPPDDLTYADAQIVVDDLSLTRFE